jgi:outer membrane protein TolC
VIGLITSTVICSSASAESLEEALTDLLSNQPRVVAAKQNQAANVEAEKAAYSACYPKLAFTDSVGRCTRCEA